MAEPCIGRDRADLVLAGCAILEALLRTWPCERMRVADRGLREGILATLMAEDGVYRGGRRHERSKRRPMTRKGRGRQGRQSKAYRRRAADEAASASTARRRTTSSQLWLERQLNDPYVAAARRAGPALARGIQADRDRRQISLPEAGRPRGRPRRGAGRLGAGGGGTGAIDGRAKARWSRSTTCRWSPFPASRSSNSIFSTTAAPAPEGAPARRRGRRRAVGHGRSDDGPYRHRPFAHHGARRGRSRFAAEVLSPGGAFLCKVLQGGTERGLLDNLKKDYAVVRHIKPPASRSDSAEMYVFASGFRG